MAVLWRWVIGEHVNFEANEMLIFRGAVFLSLGSRGRKGRKKANAHTF